MTSSKGAVPECEMPGVVDILNALSIAFGDGGTGKIDVSYASKTGSDSASVRTFSRVKFVLKPNRIVERRDPDGSFSAQCMCFASLMCYNNKSDSEIDAELSFGANIFTSGPECEEPVHFPCNPPYLYVFKNVPGLGSRRLQESLGEGLFVSILNTATHDMFTGTHMEKGDVFLAGINAVSK